MSLREIIDNDYKQSIKSKDKGKTDTLRLIKSAIKDKEIASRSSTNQKDINEIEILTLMQTMIKQRKDSIDQFQKANRDDLIKKEQEEINVINTYLPNQKSEEETEGMVIELIKNHNLVNIKDMGKLMNLIRKEHSGKVDMGLVGKIAKSKLAS